MTCGDEKKVDILCEECRWFFRDEDSGEEFCNLQLDEDEYLRFLETAGSKSCKYFCPDNGEYEIVRRQN